MQFYSLKHRKLVSVSKDALRKRRVRRGRSSSPCGARYAALADVIVDGLATTVSRFLTREAFETLDAPEVW